MSRYIEIEKASSYVSRLLGIMPIMVLNVFEANSIDIVYCGECAKRKKNKFCLEHMRYEKNDEGFCSYGVRTKGASR